LDQVPVLLETLREKVNDGFFLTNAPIALISAWFVEPEKAFQAMDFLMREQRCSQNQGSERCQEHGSKKFAWNQPAEFRFVTVKDSAVLQPVPAGFYFNSEFLSFPAFADSEKQWMKAFMRVQDFWVKNLSARPHMGKLFGFADDHGTVTPFAESFVCKLYNDTQKQEFETYRKRIDPHGLFLGGLAARLLKPCKTGTRDNYGYQEGLFAGRAPPGEGRALTALLLVLSTLLLFLD